MPVSVRLYKEGKDEPREPVVAKEFETLLSDASRAVRLGTAELLGWLHTVQAGVGEPFEEPDTIPVGGITLKYRCARAAMVIFDIRPNRSLFPIMIFGRSFQDDPTVVRVLRLTQSQGGLPLVAEVALSVERLKKWV